MAMDKNDLAELCDARDKLCRHCTINKCDSCLVTQILNDAFNECENSEGLDKEGAPGAGFACDAEFCAFNPNGLCGFPAVYHRQPVWSEDKGCEDFCYTENSH